MPKYHVVYQFEVVADNEDDAVHLANNKAADRLAPGKLTSCIVSKVEEEYHIPNLPPCLGCSDIDCKDCSASPWDEAFEKSQRE